MKPPASLSVAQKLEKLNSQFYLMVGLPLLAFIWIYLNLRTINPHDIFSVPAYRPFLHGIILFFTLGLALLALLQYHHRFKGLEPSVGGEANKEEALLQKTEQFKEASLKKYLLLTLSTILVIIGFFLSAEEGYVAAYSLMLILFSINRPTPQRLVRDMRLRKEERDLLFQILRQEREAQQK